MILKNWRHLWWLQIVLYATVRKILNDVLTPLNWGYFYYDNYLYERKLYVLFITLNQRRYSDEAFVKLDWNY